MPTIFTTPSSSDYSIQQNIRKKLESPCDLQPLTTMSVQEKISHDHSYCSSVKDIDETFQPSSERPDLENKLKRKIKALQQQLRRKKAKQQTMSDVINELQQKLLLSEKDAEFIHGQFDSLQLSIFRDTRNNIERAPCGRRYSDLVKEFATTLNFYSPKAYQYVRSVIPLPQPSLIRKWSSSIECEPGFLQESFEALKRECSTKPNYEDCFLVIDALSIRKQMLWDNQQDRYVGFVNYGPEIPPEKPDTLATEAVVFLLVGARAHWKCPIGYFLADKMTATIQATLARTALMLAADAGLRVWSITTDGTTVNIGMFKQLGCNFTTSYDSMITKFKHPNQEYYVYAILDPCHMLKLARNALADLKCIIDGENNLICWNFLSSLHRIQEAEGFKMGNKFTTKHLQFEKNKMNVALAAQTLSSSVADAINFLGSSMKLEEFIGSQPTVKFIRTIDRLFDLLNSRNPLGKGFKQPLRPETKETWEQILTKSAHYLLNLKQNSAASKLLVTHKRKTFILGFVVTIKSTIEMANEMFSSSHSFKYMLTYKFSQDHIELLFSCIRAMGGWNNNPNCLQLKYAMRKMLMRNAVTSSKNANCQLLDETSTTIIPYFHTKKHKTPLGESNTSNESLLTPEEQLLCQQIDSSSNTEFVSNILFYIGGYIVSKTLDKMLCSSCKSCLISQFTGPTTDHNYCSMNYNNMVAPSAFTLFINNGGLRVPSQSVYNIIDYSEKVFKEKVSNTDARMTNEKRLKEKLVMIVFNHFSVESTKNVFTDHDDGLNEIMFTGDHRATLIKLIAERYIRLRLYTYGKRFSDNITGAGKSSIRHQLTKLILFNGQ